MEMELYQELILTAVISLLVAFLLSRLADVSPDSAATAAVDRAAEPAASVTRPVRIGGKRVRFRDPIGESRSDPTDSGDLVAAAAAARADSVAEIAAEAGLEGESVTELTESAAETVESPESSIRDSDFDNEVNGAGLERESVIELTDPAEIGETEVNTVKLMLELEKRDDDAAQANEARMERVETVELLLSSTAASELDLEVESQVIEAILEGESVMELPDTMKIERGSAEIVELPAASESDLEVESQVIEAILEGEPVMELPKIVKIDNVSVGVTSATESRMVASEMENEAETQDGDAAKVDGAGLEEELVIEMPEIEKFDVESVKDGAQGEMVELSGGKSDIVQSPEGTSVEKKGFEDGIGGGQESGDGEASEGKLEEESLIEVPETVEVSKLAESVTQLAEEKIVQSPSAEVGIVRSLEEAGKGEKIGGDESLGSFLQGEDEWEGIERSEPEKLFAVAASYTSSAIGSEAVSRLSSNVQMELYALHKVATEGPCYELQPMALMVSSRAKWHAWQKLGNMDPEVAMEHYISLLTHSIPGWMGVQPGEKTSSLPGDTKHEEVNEPPEQGVIGTATPNLGASLDSQPSSITGRESQDHIEADSSSDDPALSCQSSR